MSALDSEISFPQAAILEAAFFAATRHRDQRRKDSDQSPYINHPLEVARTLAVEGGVEDVEVLVAALLHDTVEDTATLMDELVQQFGERVAALVSEVTDDKSLPKAERKRLQVERSHSKSDGAKQIKIADKICNVRDINSNSPVGWDTERKIQYLKWSGEVVDGCKGVNERLDQLISQLIKDGLAELAH